jgi:hypothetical protein
MSKSRVISLAGVIAGVGAFVFAGAATAAPQAPVRATPAVAHATTHTVAPESQPATATAPKRMHGSWTWWGYRTNSYETWGVATQNPSAYCGRYVPWWACSWVYALGWTWHFTAQNARSMGQCLGITWSGTGIIVGCSQQ